VSAVCMHEIERHASTWWENLRLDRGSRPKENIKTWDKMVAKL
jgi:hypothetical protein